MTPKPAPQPPNAVPHPEDFCQDCGRENAVWFTHNDVWNLSCANGNGILCPVCFMKKAELAGFKDAWRIEPEFYSERKAAPQAQGMPEAKPSRYQKLSETYKGFGNPNSPIARDALSALYDAEQEIALLRAYATQMAELAQEHDTWRRRNYEGQLRVEGDREEARERISQFQFCIDRVAEALGGVCCGGVDSTPEVQLADPHSTTRVLCDAIKREREALRVALGMSQSMTMPEVRALADRKK